MSGLTGFAVVLSKNKVSDEYAVEKVLRIDFSFAALRKC